MILTAGSRHAAKYSIRDCNGNTIPYVYSFDTESKEIEMLVIIGEDEHGRNRFLFHIDPVGVAVPVKVKTVVKGAHVVRDGKEVENLEEDIKILDRIKPLEIINPPTGITSIFDPLLEIEKYVGINSVKCPV